jgi:hypothetical protein
VGDQFDEFREALREPSHYCSECGEPYYKCACNPALTPKSAAYTKRQNIVALRRIFDALGPDAMAVVRGETTPKEPESFGRFTYCGHLWGIPHVWSSCDPPNYGAIIGLSDDGGLVERRSGESGHPRATWLEIDKAKKLLVAASRTHVPEAKRNLEPFRSLAKDMKETSDDFSGEMAGDFMREWADRLHAAIREVEGG